MQLIWCLLSNTFDNKDQISCILLVSLSSPLSANVYCTVWTGTSNIILRILYLYVLNRDDYEWINSKFLFYLQYYKSIVKKFTLLTMEVYVAQT